MSVDEYVRALADMETVRWTGHVREMTGLLIGSEGPAAAVGDFCEILPAGGPVRAQVVGFREGRVLLMPLEETTGLQLGDLVVTRAEAAQVEVSPRLLGRVLDGFGKPMDSGPAIEAECLYPLYGKPPGPLEREPIAEPLVTGVRAIDSLLPFGKGQRVGILADQASGRARCWGRSPGRTRPM